MPDFLPFDVIAVPLAGLVDRVLLDFDILNIVIWWPRLSWTEIGQALGALFACKWASDQLERLAFAPLKSCIRSYLSRQMVEHWPGVARRLKLSGGG